MTATPYCNLDREVYTTTMQMINHTGFANRGTKESGMASDADCTGLTLLTSLWYVQSASLRRNTVYTHEHLTLAFWSRDKSHTSHSSG